MTTAAIPSPGLGTSGNADPDQCVETVRTALELGYRHVDTAQMYDNESAVGRAIRESGVAREEVFLATKVLPGNLAADDVVATTEASLERLGVDAVDLLYVHWPLRAYDPGETLPAFDELHDRGLTRLVGLSNFTPALLDEARGLLDAPVVAHQVECHPLLQQAELRSYAREHGHALVAYCPLMRGEVTEVPELVEIAEAEGVTPAGVALAWLADTEAVVPIPKATGEAHLRENLAVPELPAEALARVDAIDRERRVVDPDGAAWN